MFKDDLLLAIAREFYLEDTGLFVSSDTETEWKSVTRQFPQKFNLALAKAKPYITDWLKQMIRETEQADFRSLILQFWASEKQQMPVRFIEGVYGLFDGLDLLYIGESQDIFNRVKRHRRDGIHGCRGENFKTVRYLEIVENPFLRKQLEKVLISSSKPLLQSATR